MTFFKNDTDKKRADMKPRILIVEDEILIACELEAILEDLGCEPIGIATDTRSALNLAERQPDLALVDLNLRDGPTGPRIGELFASRFNIPVLFVTANPRLLGKGVAGTIGVLTKPYDASIIKDAVTYALSVQVDESLTPPNFIMVFTRSKDAHEQADRA